MSPLRRQKTITCQELVELVTDYLDGALSKRDRSRFELHISGCTNCRQYVDQFRETVRLAGTLRESDVPPAVADELLSHFADWKRERA
jgi:anti-sigma factor RsiW